MCTNLYPTNNGEGNGTPLQCSCLENPKDGGAWWAAVHGVVKSRTRLSDFTFTHWRRKWQPTPVFLPGESQEWRSLVGCGLWGSTESDTTERLNWTELKAGFHVFYSYFCSVRVHVLYQPLFLWILCLFFPGIPIRWILDLLILLFMSPKLSFVFVLSFICALL